MDIDSSRHDCFPSLQKKKQQPDMDKRTMSLDQFQPGHRMAAQPAYVPPLLAVPQMGAVATEPLAPEAKFPGGACGPGPLSHCSGMNPIAGIPPSPVAPRQRRGSMKHRSDVAAGFTILVSIASPDARRSANFSHPRWIYQHAANTAAKPVSTSSAVRLEHYRHRVRINQWLYHHTP